MMHRDMPSGSLDFPSVQDALRMLRSVEAELLSLDRDLAGPRQSNDARADRALRHRRDRLVRYANALCHCCIYRTGGHA